MLSGKRGQTFRGRGNQGMTHGKFSGEIHAGLRGRKQQEANGRGKGETVSGGAGKGKGEHGV